MSDWNYYFHESAVAKMVSGDNYQQGYAVGFSSGYQQGRLLSLKDWEDVLNELENIYSDEHENQYGNGIHKAIDIINNHLVGLKYNERIRE